MKLINDLVPGVWPMVIIICVIVIDSGSKGFIATTYLHGGMDNKHIS